MFSMYKATEILPRVFIGGASVAGNRSFFVENNIRRVVNCTSGLPNYFEDYAEYMKLNIWDSTSERDQLLMVNSIPKTNQFIHMRQPNEGVLVHCHWGVSRSCTIMAAYLREFHCATLQEAINFIVQRRPQAFFRGSNLNFKKALLHLYMI